MNKINRVFPIVIIVMILISAKKSYGKDEHFGSESIANAGVTFFTASSVSVEISEWFFISDTFSIIKSELVRGTWLGFDQGIYFDQKKAAGYLDAQFSIQGPFNATATGISIGAQINKNGYPTFQNSIWISLPSLVSPTISVRTKFESGALQPEFALTIKVPIYFHGLGH